MAAGLALQGLLFVSQSGLAACSRLLATGRKGHIRESFCCPAPSDLPGEECLFFLFSSTWRSSPRIGEACDLGQVPFTFFLSEAKGEGSQEVRETLPSHSCDTRAAVPCPENLGLVPPLTAPMATTSHMAPVLPTTVL